MKGHTSLTKGSNNNNLGISILLSAPNYKGVCFPPLVYPAVDERQARSPVMQQSLSGSLVLNYNTKLVVINQTPALGSNCDTNFSLYENQVTKTENYRRNIMLSTSLLVGSVLKRELT